MPPRKIDVILVGALCSLLIGYIIAIVLTMYFNPHK